MQREINEAFANVMVLYPIEKAALPYCAVAQIVLTFLESLKPKNFLAELALRIIRPEVRRAVAANCAGISEIS